MARLVCKVLGPIYGLFYLAWKLATFRNSEICYCGDCGRLLPYRLPYCWYCGRKV